jgi:hypothetical protein
MKRIILILAFFFSFSQASGTYDRFFYTDTQEKFSLFFLNTATSNEFVSIGLSTNDYNSIANLRPFASATPAQISSSLATVSNNSNITGNDMKRLREYSHRVIIPDQNTTMTDYNRLGIKQFDFNFLMGFVGAMFGFVFLFFTVFLAVNLGRNNN